MLSVGAIPRDFLLVLSAQMLTPHYFQGLKKPYNPILGETFRCCWLHPKTNSCTFYIAEQVSVCTHGSPERERNTFQMSRSSSLHLRFLCFLLSQVSHHPPISAFHVCNRKDGFSISGSILAKSKFYGREEEHSL